MLNRERRCIVTGKAYDESLLIRFVLGPQGQVVPDLASKMPGRGAWIRSIRCLVDTACRRELFARAFRCPASSGDDLCMLVEEQLSKLCLDLLGLARKAGKMVFGFEKVRSWLIAEKAAVLIHANNGSEQEFKRLVSVGNPVPTLDIFDKLELSLALGRENVVYAAMTSGGLADRLLYESSRLAGFRPACQNMM